VVQLAGSNGAIVWQYDYDAFGNEREILGQDPALEANRWRYCGEYFDKETGTIYLRARYYSPVVGRFLTEDTHWNPGNMIYGDYPVKWNEREADLRDPLGLNTYTYKPDIAAIMQSGNLYAYCMGNPVGFIDPDGNDAIYIYTSGGLAGHASLLVQDSKGNWYYSYWAINIVGLWRVPRAVMDANSETIFDPMASLDNFNKYLALINKQAPTYNSATYFTGDTSDSYEYLLSKKTKADNMWLLNWQYHLYFNNCAQASVNALSKSYAEINKQSIVSLVHSALPYLSWEAIAKILGNTSFTKPD
jgi:RHS repeat-associated protein